MFDVGITIEGKDGDRLRQRVDDPVFGHATLGIVVALVDQITLGLVGVDDFDNEVGPEPVAVLSPGIAFVEEDKQIGFAELARANPQA
jgi:hypothetical protein